MKNRDLVNRNASLLDDFFSQFPDLFEWRRPDGGCVAFPRYSGEEGADAFCEDLLKHTGVLLLPPRVYSSKLSHTPKDRFRIGFGRRHVAEGLKVFRDYLMRT
jgi:hypothetical protein